MIRKLIKRLKLEWDTAMEYGIDPDFKTTVAFIVSMLALAVTVFHFYFR